MEGQATGCTLTCVQIPSKRVLGLYHMNIYCLTYACSFASVACITAAISSSSTTCTTNTHNTTNTSISISCDGGLLGGGCARRCSDSNLEEGREKGWMLEIKEMQVWGSTDQQVLGGVRSFGVG